MFSKFLRNKGIVPDDFPTYEHEFVNQNRPAVYARLYPIKYLEEFRKYFYYTWMPTKSLEYFRQRAPEVLPVVERILSLPAPKAKTAQKVIYVAVPPTVMVSTLMVGWPTPTGTH